MKKKKKQPKELMIKSVIADLEKEMQESSIRPQQSEGESRAVFSSAVLNPEGPVSDTTEHKNSETQFSKSIEIPIGLNLTEKQKQAYVKQAPSKPSDDDKTQLVDAGPVANKPGDSHEALGDRTNVVGNFLGAQAPKPEQKISFGGQSRSSGYEAQFMQAENLKIAQQRIIELEKDIEKLRKENEILASAGELSQQKIEDFLSRINVLERQRNELKETSVSELQIFREGLIVKESEISRLQSKVSELESRLSNDLRKIRVRERELENRLELSKMEKMALLKSKDETILDLKRKNDTLVVEIESYQNKIIELNQRIESNQEQFGRTVRALRIALTNLEVNENTSSITIAPLKKAE